MTIAKQSENGAGEPVKTEPETFNYMVGVIYETDKGKRQIMYETFHTSIQSAIVAFEERNDRRAVILKVLNVKTVVVDYDASGPDEHKVR